MQSAYMQVKLNGVWDEKYPVENRRQQPTDIVQFK